MYDGDETTALPTFEVIEEDRPAYYMSPIIDQFGNAIWRPTREAPKLGFVGFMELKERP